MLPKSIIFILLLLSFVTYSASAQTAKIPADLVDHDASEPCVSEPAPITS